MSTDLSQDAPTRAALRELDRPPVAAAGRGSSAYRRGDGAADGSARRTAGTRLSDLLTPAAILTLLGILVPLGVFVWLATFTPPTFDGGMNLQVAQNLAAGRGYADDYNGIHLFPWQVQTSGPYIFLAAGAIKLFGNHTFVYQLPNLLAIALLLVAVSVGLRRWPVLRVVGPSVVLFAVPATLDNGMNGYGEYIVAALVVMAVVLIDMAVQSRRPLLLATVAFALLGLAFTVKVIALLAIPVLLIGWLLAVLARRDLSVLRALVPLSGAAVVIALFELYRLVVLGASGYVSYWQDQIVDIGGQAGVSTGGATLTGKDDAGMLTKITDHLHLLSLTTKGLWAPGAVIPTSLICLVLVLPFVMLLTLFLSRGAGWRLWLQHSGNLLAVQLAAYAGGYLVWWLAITPTEKAWLRRLAIGLLALAMLYLVLSGLIRERLHDRTLLPTSGPARPLLRTGWIAAAVAFFVVTLSAVATVRAQSVQAAGSTDYWENVDVSIAQRAAQLHAEGHPLYGAGWWQAPVIALYGDLALTDLSRASPCDAAFAPDRPVGYLLWDNYAARIATPAGWKGDPPYPPGSARWTLTQIGGITDPNDPYRYTGIWEIKRGASVKCAS